MAAYLLWERTQGATARKTAKLPAYLVWLTLGLILFSYLPVRLIQEANQDWILINWTMTAIAASITFLILYTLGGKSWLGHFGFPIIFIFTAVPWPVVFENFVLQNLMQINAMVTAEFLTIVGHPSIAYGNIIDVGGEFINVDDACSGIRSLQTSFMMSLFLGEFYRIGWLQRTVLTLSSFAVAFLVNLGRTYTLAYAGGVHGSEKLSELHDIAGYVALALCLSGIWLIAYLFSRFSPSVSPKTNLPNETPSTVSNWRSTAAVGGIILMWVAISEISTAVWYKAKESKLIQAPVWDIEWPKNVDNFREEPFSDITSKILKFSEGKSASWSQSDGDQWTMYLLKWNEGRVSKSLAGAHSPDICLPAAGFKLHSFLGYHVITIDKLDLQFRVYLFKDGENSYFYVFHCIWEDKYLPEEDILEIKPLSRKARIEAVLAGKRNLGQKVLGVSVKGPTNLDQAKSQLRMMLSESINLEK